MPHDFGAVRHNLQGSRQYMPICLSLVMTQGLLSESPFEVRLYTRPFREQLCVLVSTASNPIGFRWWWKVLVRYSGKLKKLLKPPTRSPWVQKNMKELQTTSQPLEGLIPPSCREPKFMQQIPNLL